MCIRDRVGGGQYNTKSNPLLISGKIYARLKQLDLNGDFTVFDIIIIYPDIDCRLDTRVFPNPTSSDINFVFGYSDHSDYKVLIYDSLMRVVFQKEFTNLTPESLDFQESSKFVITLEDIPMGSGVYFASIVFEEGRNFSELIKFVVMKE